MKKSEGIINEMIGWAKSIQLDEVIDNCSTRFIYKYHEITREDYHEVIENATLSLTGESTGYNYQLLSSFNDSLEEYVFTLTIIKKPAKDLPHYFGGDF